MITRTAAFLTSDNKTHATLDEAQRHALELLIPPLGDGGYSNTQVALLIKQHAPKIIDILTTTAMSKPKARSINGGKKSRKPAVDLTVSPVTPKA